MRQRKTLDLVISWRLARYQQQVQRIMRSPKAQESPANPIMSSLFQVIEGLKLLLQKGQGNSQVKQHAPIVKRWPAPQVKIKKKKNHKARGATPLMQKTKLKILQDQNP